MENIKRILNEEIEKVFLLSERIVSEDIKSAASFVLNEIVDFESEILEQNWKPSTNGKAKVFMDDFYINSKDLFFKNFLLTLRLVKLKSFEGISKDELFANNHGNFNDESMMLTENKKAISGKIRLNIFYKEGNINNNITLGLIYHELLHYYESYKRLLKYGEKSFSNLHSVYNIAHKKMALDGKAENKPFLYGLGTLVYCLCYFERNAFMSTLYGELIRVSCNSIECLKGQFKETKTYNNYYIFLENPEEIFNKSMISEDLDLQKINEIIKNSVESYNETNINNKVKLENIEFYYNGEGIEKYINKIYKLVKKSKERTDKKLPYAFEKILFDRKKKILAIRESDLFFLQNIPNRILTVEESYKMGLFKI